MTSLLHLGPSIGRGPDAEKIALIDCFDWDQPRCYTYSQLSARIERVAGGLRARGLMPGARIAIVASNSADYLVSYYAILRSGLVCVPLNYKLHADTVAFLLADCAVDLVLHDAEHKGALPQGLHAIEFGSEQWSALLLSEPIEALPPAPQATAVILYTSGSTGRPKGVPLTHGGLQWTVETRTSGLSAQSEHCLLVAAPLYHMNGLGNSAFAFASVATLVLLPSFDTGHFIAAIERFRVTWITCVPTMLAMVLKRPDLLSQADLASVKIVRMGSAAFTPQLLAQVKKAFPAASVGNAYGTTETGSIAFGPARDGTPAPELSLGWPLEGVEARIVDAAGREATEGVVWMRTPATMKGYLNLPDRTAEVLSEDGWYLTGDVMRRDAAGAHYFVGRIDDMFSCGGENVFPGEVEQLLERHPGVAQACVVAVPDEIKGAKPIAFVVPRPGAILFEEEVRKFALANGPAYQHPRRVIVLGSLPLAGTNKIDRSTLTKRAIAVMESHLDGNR